MRSLDDLAAQWRKGGLSFLAYVSQLCPLLSDFDCQYVAFEKVYIPDLIEIEREAKRPLSQAVSALRALQSCQRSNGQGESEGASDGAMAELVEKVKALNCEANCGQDRSADELNVAIWKKATVVILIKILGSVTLGNRP